MSDHLHATERFLHEQIPLTRAMGVRVARFDEEGLVLTAPLEPNHNHLGTAFGGSLSAIATLTGYALLWLELGDRDSHIVIKGSSLKFRHPVRGEIRAVCPRIDAEALAAFRGKFARTGKAGISLRVAIVENGVECVEFEGLFVALR
ncbi:YiiD C-terminal domain-containing protein [Luteolibacter sp. SL250]|uniref:YiiD C-terminal domain-containing protein n=1 Tax=Luteolibacter sp. SL250 TaxID=2995170 RepID=UPI00226FF557|nr:YiiD C-terminal domain-containing protein [Luteolibacter sp. SL250]WAC17917.1 YiiD C-terminal domain-containing protein [Luteolibacter sp. SL250]